MLLDRIVKEVDNVWLAPTLAKMYTSETLMEVARGLATFHRSPFPFYTNSTRLAIA